MVDKVSEFSYDGGMINRISMIDDPKQRNLTMRYTEYETDSFLDDELEETANCYLCFLEQTGRPDMSERGDQGPLRRVLGHSITEAHRDPTDVLHLDCGHAII